MPAKSDFFAMLLALMTLTFGMSTSFAAEPGEPAEVVERLFDSNQGLINVGKIETLLSSPTQAVKISEIRLSYNPMTYLLYLDSEGESLHYVVKFTVDGGPVKSCWLASQSTKKQMIFQRCDLSPLPTEVDQPHGRFPVAVMPIGQIIQTP